MEDDEDFIDYWEDIDYYVNNAYNTALKLRDVTNYSILTHDLRNAMKNLKGFQSIHYYGSRMSGLANQSSDLDIFIQIDNNFHKRTSRNRMTLALREVAKIYKNNKKFPLIKIIDTARFPLCVVQYTNREYQVSMTITLDHSFMNGLGVHFNKTINHWLSMHRGKPRKLALFMRNWFDMGPMKDYDFHKVLDLMVIYLQQCLILPSFHTMRKRAKQPIMIDGVHVEFDEEITATRGRRRGGNNRSYNMRRMSGYKKHILGFFEYYVDFDFANYAISPYTSDVSRIDNLLNVARLYEHREDLEDIVYDEDRDPMIVLGFLEAGRNLAFDVDDDGVEIFQEFCQDSIDLIEDLTD